MDKPKRYLPDPEVCQRYNVSDMSISRWTKDPRLNFPQPIYIRGRKYRDLDELEEFEERQRQASAGPLRGCVVTSDEAA
jgi:predicted DNA-binding transcriptional regulator AlpA